MPNEPAWHQAVDSIIDRLERLAEALQSERRAREQLAADVATLRVELGVKSGLDELTKRLDAIDAGAKAEAADGKPTASVLTIAR